MKIYNTKLYENDQPFLFYASLLVHPPRPFPAFSFQTRNIEDGFSTTPAFFFFHSQRAQWRRFTHTRHLQPSKKEASRTLGALPPVGCPGNPLCGLSARSAALY